ncbi:MAG: hypothetical protein EHM49_00355 [Deltaproteobacteria bacterium]|nr:MAG: hypothetical protein EHM49_00355 [Deltaproteobacteria bacterium]
MENSPVITEEYKGYTVEVHYDDDAESPRMWSNLGTMVCFHRRYSLGDVEKIYSSPEEFVLHLARNYMNQHIAESDYENLSDRAFITKYMKLLDRYIISLPLYLYDHSGITISTAPFNCSWDSGQVGWIFIARESVREEFKVQRIGPKLKKKTLAALRGEVEVYDQFLQGEVYGYAVKDSEDKDVDSCWGFFDSPDKVLVEGKEVVDAIIKHGK